MKVFIIFLVTLASSCLYGQKNADSISKNELAFDLDKDIRDYKDLDRYPCMAKPHLYRYFAGENDSITLGKIKFSTLSISTNKHEKITKVSYFKNYSSTDSAYLVPLLNQDFETISNWLVNIYGSKYKIIRPTSDPGHYRQGIAWRIKKRTIKLIKVWGEVRGAENQILNYLELTTY